MITFKGYIVLKKYERINRDSTSYKYFWRFKKNAEDERRELEERFKIPHTIRRIVVVVDK